MSISEFSTAKIKMKHEFMADEGLLLSYQSNIAMLLHDGFIGKRFVTSKKGCNIAAERIMNLIFSTPIRSEDAEVQI